MRQVCVDSDFQQKGIGTKMIEFSEKWAKENNYTNIECNARESAVSYYEKHGYQKLGKAFREVSIPHFRMKKSL